MIFVCDSCGLVFEHSYESGPCPNCGEQTVRAADELEQAEYARYMAGVDEDGCVSPFPDLVELNIELIDYFRFRLPATAFEVDSERIVEVLVEHGISAKDPATIQANVWTRSPGGEFSDFLMPITVPVAGPETPQDRAGRIVAALNDSSLFSQKMTELFLHLALDEGNG